MKYKKNPDELVYAKRRVPPKTKEFNKMCSKGCNYKTNSRLFVFCPMCKAPLEFRKW